MLKYIEKAVFNKTDNTEKLRVIPSVIHSIQILDKQEKTSPGGTLGEGGGGKKNELLQHAREMRKNPTTAERALWNVLRKKNLEGYKFRRQHPIGNYIVDFYCPMKKLAIEVDGGQHSEQEEQDAERTAFFELKGCRVIRFWNKEVLENIQGVVDRIVEELDK